MQNPVLENIDLLEILIISEFPIKIIFKGCFIDFIPFFWMFRFRLQLPVSVN